VGENSPFKATSVEKGVLAARQKPFNRSTFGKLLIAEIPARTDQRPRAHSGFVQSFAERDEAGDDSEREEHSTIRFQFDHRLNDDGNELVIGHGAEVRETPGALRNRSHQSGGNLHVP